MTDDLTPKTFNLLATLAGQEYPEGSVTIYTDVKALREFEVLSEEADAEDDAKKVNALDRKRKAVRKRILDSAVTFHLRGFPPKILKEITAATRAQFNVPAGDDLDAPEHTAALRHRNLKTVSTSLVRVENANGEVDAGPFTVEYVEGLEDFLDEGEWLKLQLRCYELSFRSITFDAAVTPDF